MQNSILTLGQKLTAICMCGVLLGGCAQGQAAEAAEPGASSTSAQTITLASGSYRPTLALSGTLEAATSSLVSAKTAGRIATLYADTGSSVAAGQLLGELAGDEMAVGLSTAQTSESDMRSIYESQKVFFAQQIEGAKRGIATSEAALAAAKQGTSDTRQTTDEQIKLAEQGVVAAETAVLSVKNVAARRLDSLYEAAPSTINNAVLAVTGAHNFYKTLIDIEDRNNCGACKAYEQSLGALDASAYTAAETALTASFAAASSFTYTYGQTADPSASRDTVNAAMRDLNKLLKATRHTVRAFNTLFEKSSAIGVVLTESQLQTFKTASLQYGQTIEAAANSLSGDTKIGVDGWLTTHDEIATQNDAEISNIQSQLLIAKQQLAQARAGSAQGVSTAGSQATVLAAQLEQAKNALAAVEAQRDTTLRGLEHNIELAGGARRLGEVGMQNTKITAPFSGVITKKLAEKGEVVAPGQPVFEISSEHLFKVKTTVSDDKIGVLRNGLAADITIDGSDGTYAATLTKLEPSVDSFAHKLTIELTLSEAPASLRVGQFARIALHLPAEEGFFVPRNFVHSDFDGQYVRLQDGTRQPVTLGSEQNGKIEIRSDGIHAGQVIQ